MGKRQDPNDDHPFIDLHGMNAPDAMDAFVPFHNRCASRSQSYLVVHGYHHGCAIQESISLLLFAFREGGFVATYEWGPNNNLGRTFVVPLKPLRATTSDAAYTEARQSPQRKRPAASVRYPNLARGILAFCRTGRTEPQIRKKYERVESGDIPELIADLVNRGRIVVTTEDGRDIYRTSGDNMLPPTS